MPGLSDLRRAAGPAVLTLLDGARPGDGPGSDGDGVELVRRVAEGDATALAELYQRHAGVVLSQILLMVGERSLAEEILQDTMLAVWRQADSFRGESRVRSWVIAIARRQARDRLRRHQLRVVDDGVLTGRPSAEPGPELVALARAEVADVADAIQRLSLSHREVLGLALGSGLSLTEVAHVLEVPLGTVKSRLAAARAALGRKLIEKGHHR
jgi:RNA polymerase sigma factor (sigma-70 family)